MDTTETDRRAIAVRHGVLLKNDLQAQRNRESFQARGLFVVNVLASPGAGKTSLLERTVADLNPKHPCAVVVGDLATDNDARRLAKPGVVVQQITTGNVCHLDAAMVARACDEIDLIGRRLLFIENVGNLVCPAAYDLGENVRIVLLAVTEGEDKPLKYPKMFKTADAVLLSKTDLASAVGFDAATAYQNIRDIAPQADVLEVSARTGAGLADWYAWLLQRVSHAAS